jgi:hypothetical protein
MVVDLNGEVIGKKIDGIEVSDNLNILFSGFPYLSLVECTTGDCIEFEIDSIDDLIKGLQLAKKLWGKAELVEVTESV